MPTNKTTAANGHSSANNLNNRLSPVLAGAVGMVAGAAVTMLLDSKTRGQLVKVIEKAIDQARLTGESSRQVAEETVAKLADVKDKAMGQIESKTEQSSKVAKKARN